MTEENLLDIVTQGNKEAERLLTAVAERHPDKVMGLMVDLQDMRITGAAIVAAAAICEDMDGEYVDALCAAVTSRQAWLVEALQDCGFDAVRQHGEEKRLPLVDGAVKDILAQAKEENIERMPDNEAEAVHNFFLRLMREMQRRGAPALPVDGKRLLEHRYYLGQADNPDTKMLCTVLDDYVRLRRAPYVEMKINIASSPAMWAKFVVSMVQIEDREGNPIKEMLDVNSEGRDAGGSQPEVIQQPDQTAAGKAGPVGDGK